MEKNRLLPTYLYSPIKKEENTTTQQITKETPIIPRILPIPKINPVEYNEQEEESGYLIVLEHFFIKPTSNLHSDYCALELHIHSSILGQNQEGNITDSKKYRIFQQTGNTKHLIVKDENKNHLTKGEKKIYQTSTIEEAESMYLILYEKYLKNSYKEFQSISPKIGSNLKKSNNLYSTNEESLLLKPIQELVSLIYEEAKLKTENLLSDSSVLLESLSLQDIEESESILMQIAQEIKK